MAQCVKGLDIKLDDLFLILRTHMMKKENHLFLYILNIILLVLWEMYIMSFYYTHNICVDETVWHRTVDLFYLLKKLHKLLCINGCINLHTHIRNIEYSFFGFFLSVHFIHCFPHICDFMYDSSNFHCGEKISHLIMIEIFLVTNVEFHVFTINHPFCCNNYFLI